MLRGRKRKSLKDLKYCSKILEILEKNIGDYIKTEEIRSYVFGGIFSENMKFKQRQEIRVIVNQIKNRDIFVEGKRGYGYKLVEPKSLDDLYTDFFSDRKISWLGGIKRWIKYFKYIQSSEYVNIGIKAKAEDNEIMLQAVVRYIEKT